MTKKASKKKAPTTLIAVPTMGWLRAELSDWARQQPNTTMISSLEVSPVAFARNKLVDVFLQNDFDYLLMVDCDTVPSRDTLKRLLDISTDKMTVATGVTAIKKGGQICPNVYIEAEHVEGCHSVAHFTKPFEVVGCGASCLLMSRELLEKMEKPYFKTTEFDEGKICSEDLYFCDKVREVGGKIICDPQVVCTHFKEVGLKV